MAIYQPTGSGIGTLLRMIREERSGSPLVSPQAEPGAPIRELMQEPVMGAESPGASREVNIKPEGVAPETAGRLEEKAPLGTSRVGPLAIGGEDVGAIPQPEIPQEPQFNIPGKGDVNPATGKAYAVNPGSGVWDDNYWANTVEPALKAGTFNQPEQPNVPSKSDINPDTGRPYGVNAQGIWDDNYYANTVEPALKAGTFHQKQGEPAPQQEQQQQRGQVLGTTITATPDIGGLNERIKASQDADENLYRQMEGTNQRYEEALQPIVYPDEVPGSEQYNKTTSDLREFLKETKRKENEKNKIPVPTPTPIPTQIR